MGKRNRTNSRDPELKARQVAKPQTNRARSRDPELKARQVVKAENVSEDQFIDDQPVKTSKPHRRLVKNSEKAKEEIEESKTTVVRSKRHVSMESESDEDTEPLKKAKKKVNPTKQALSTSIDKQINGLMEYAFNRIKHPDVDFIT